MSSNQSSVSSNDNEKNVIDKRGAKPLSIKNETNKDNDNNVQYLNISDNDSTFMLYDELIELCINNMTYYNKDKTSKGQRLHGAFVELLDHIENIKPLVQNIAKFAPEYDFDENTAGNGYRSFLYVSKSSVKHSLKVCRYIKDNRSSLLFRKGIYMKEIEACNHLIASVCTCLNLLLIIRGWCDQGELFTIENHEPHELFSKTEPINQYVFYGRCIGFQFCESIRNFLKIVSISMAGFSEAYYRNGGKLANATNGLWTSGKCYIDPELRSHLIVNVISNANANFCKSFWLLHESKLMKIMPSIMGAQLKINKVVVIHPEPLQTVNINTGEFVTIPIPFSHVGFKPIYGRVLSATSRDSMDSKVGCRRRSFHEMTNKLIFHIHGGGFVGQSSKSHETYLKDWTSKLNIPIFSIDYSLAPEAPFPRALEELYYAYCWTFKNAETLGTTAETIILAGDSAGANLCLSLGIKIIENGVRKPNGIFAAFCPTLLPMNISPARLLSIIDPFIPYGFMVHCTEAYIIGNGPNATSKQEISETTSTIENDNNIIKSNSINLKSQLAIVDEAKKQEESGRNIGSETVSDNSEVLKLNSFVGTDTKRKSDFIDRNVLTKKDSKGNKNLIRHGVLRTQSEENIVFGIGRKAKTEKNIQEKIQKRAEDFVNISNIPETKNDIFVELGFEVPNDPYLSPYLASDDILKRMPKVQLLTTHMDPCIDDCIMFAKKLKKLGVPVGLDIINDLPHGFLSLSLLSKEARLASKLCMKRISKLFDIGLESVDMTNDK